MQRLLDMAKEGTFKYAGRDNAPDSCCSPAAGRRSSSTRPATRGASWSQSAKFDWGEAMLPYDPEVIQTPINSIIGGASLWTMTAPDARRPNTRRWRSSCSSSASPSRIAEWHQHTGYVPVTFGGLRAVAEAGLLREEPRRRFADQATDARAR